MDLADSETLTHFLSFCQSHRHKHTHSVSHIAFLAPTYTYVAYPHPKTFTFIHKHKHIHPAASWHWRDPVVLPVVTVVFLLGRVSRRYEGVWCVGWVGRAVVDQSIVESLIESFSFFLEQSILFPAQSVQPAYIQQLQLLVRDTEQGTRGSWLVHSDAWSL